MQAVMLNNPPQVCFSFQKRKITGTKAFIERGLALLFPCHVMRDKLALKISANVFLQSKHNI